MLIFFFLADVFKQFEKGDEFVCFPGQSSQAITGLFNLFRASQFLLPGEKILENARKFCSKFLREKQTCNQLEDKWIIAKDLAGEVWCPHHYFCGGIYGLKYVFYLNIK